MTKQCVSLTIHIPHPRVRWVSSWPGCALTFLFLPLLALVRLHAKDYMQDIVREIAEVYFNIVYEGLGMVIVQALRLQVHLQVDVRKLVVSSARLMPRASCRSAEG